ncbi:hypothetical protein PG993_005853 [Apiospora rasikravindrae]|uniref:Uncharacterized protein n=1 Tax=Apiospora rasikravindrae TaxID=990691 RepID=A0ABR1T9Z0_9PEZI
MSGQQESHANRAYLQDRQGAPTRQDQPVRPQSPSNWEEDSLQDDDTEFGGSTGYAPVQDGSGKTKTDPKSTDKHSWVMEISTMILCLSSVVTSTVLLFYANGRPLTDYNFFISFNTLISILAAIARATLAFAVGSCLGQWKWNWFSKRSDTPVMFASFEDASRGPWGSFWLLCHLRIRHWVNIGACVTLLMLGFEPFMQALIYYEGQLVTTTQPPTAPSIGASQRLDVGSTKKIKTDVLSTFQLRNMSYPYSAGLFRREPSAGLAAAVYRGFYANDPRDAVSFTCSTGNCTWSVFPSLSVCSACNDVSDQVKVSGQDGANLGTIRIKGFDLVGHWTTHALPYVNITNLAEFSGVGMVGRRAQFDPMAMTSAYTVAKSLDNPGNTLTFGALDTMITAVGLLRAEPAFANHSKGWNETRVTTTECALYFCTTAYRSEVSGGKLQEEVVASWSERVPGSYTPAASEKLDNVTWSAYEEHINRSLSTGDAFYTFDDLQLRIPPSEAEKHSLPADAPRLFNVTQNTIGSILPFLAAFFGDPLVYGESDLGSLISQTLHESADPSATFARAAATMSNWLRDNSGVTRPGDQKEWVLHIRVRWPYVTLPGLVVLLGCGFVFLSVWETRRLRLPPWKTDVLATLTHSLDAGTRERLREAALQGRVKEWAKGMVLNFEDVHGQGLELRAEDHRPTTERGAG